MTLQNQRLAPMRAEGNFASGLRARLASSQPTAAAATQGEACKQKTPGLFAITGTRLARGIQDGLQTFVRYFALRKDLGLQRIRHFIDLSVHLIR
jgi:hypothetical protein